MASPMGTRISDDQQKLKDSEDRFLQVQQRYGPKNPAYNNAMAESSFIRTRLPKTLPVRKRRLSPSIKSNSIRKALVQTQLATAKSEYDQLNMRMLDYQQAKQEATQDRSLLDEW